MTQLSPEIDADIRYEVVLMGPNVQNWIGPLTSDLRDAFKDYMLDPSVFLGVSNAQQFQDDQDGDICVGVWMGSLHANRNRVDLEVLEWMLVNKIPVFPVVDSLSGFENKVPPRLHHVNGMSWNSRTLTAELMAAFKLVGNIRRAFVSYRRAESMGVAVQLFEELSKKGYEVFLDTASVLPGIPFQEALWSRMSNADLVVFLDSPQALDSQWVHQEIGRANAHGLGLLQIVWPNHTPSIGTGFCDQVLLADNDFIGLVNHPQSRLSDACISMVLTSAERCRIKSLANRRRYLSDAANMIAEKLQLELLIHPVHPYLILKNQAPFVRLIPHIGLPDAKNLHSHERDYRARFVAESSAIPIAVLFDGLGMDVAWADHLQWLNGLNPIKVKSTSELEQWIEGL